MLSNIRKLNGEVDWHMSAAIVLCNHQGKRATGATAFDRAGNPDPAPPRAAGHYHTPAAAHAPRQAAQPHRRQEADAAQSPVTGGQIKPEPKPAPQRGPVTGPADEPQAD